MYALVSGFTARYLSARADEREAVRERRARFPVAVRRGDFDFAEEARDADFAPLRREEAFFLVDERTGLEAPPRERRAVEEGGWRVVRGFTKGACGEV